MVNRRHSFHVSRRASLAAKKRTINHIEQFISINVKFPQNQSLMVIIDKNSTVGYAARQIEAEYHFREQRSDENLFQISQLYDSMGEPLHFDSLISDTIQNFDETITAVGFGDFHEPDKQHDSNISIFDFTKLEAINDAMFNKLNEVSSIEERLNIVLHNLVALQFFNEFCLNENNVENVLFWIEVEVYKTIEDSQKSLKFANYLYLIYLNSEGPLFVNVDQEVIFSIQWPFVVPPRRDIFDEAQFCVYNTIKGFAYMRFENSFLFQNFLKYKLNDPYSYIQAQANWHNESTKLNFDKIDGVIDILTDPISEKAKEVLGEGKYGPIEFRHILLKDTFARYFPIVSPVIRGYFSEENRSQKERKVKLMVKQRKLSKFFGRGSSDINNTLSRSLVQVEKFSLEDEENGHITSEKNLDEIISTGNKEDFEETALRRKKAEKLNLFFGKPLDTRAMLNQNLLSQSNLSYVPPQINFTNMEEDLILTHNLLSLEERAALTRRAKKINMVFGEIIDSKILNNLKHGISNQKCDDNNSAQSSPRSSVSPYLDSISNFELETRNIQKQRLSKLSKFLGHRIKDEDILDLPQVEALKGVPRPLTDDEKKRFQHRSNKIEAMLGVAVPATEILHYLNPVQKEDSDDGLYGKSSDKIHNDLAVEYDISSGKQNMMYKLRKVRKLLGNDVKVGQIDTNFQKV